MIEKSLVLIKPDAVKKNIIGTIISYYEKNNLDVKKLKMLTPTKEILEKHYAEHKGRDYYEKLIKFMLTGPLVAMVLEGEDAIKKIREINGATDPKKAKEGTIRYKYAKDGTENIVHASDSPENAEKEISIWFN